MANSVTAPLGGEVSVDGTTDTRSGAGFWGLTLGSIGVVYGDIGTSPLYALREAIVAASGANHETIARELVLGVVSLILWAFFVIVTVKYVLILLRADNNGEGGTLTLMALASRAVVACGPGRRVPWRARYGRRGTVLRRAVITPAISVLSAVEGTGRTTRRFTISRCR